MPVVHSQPASFLFNGPPYTLSFDIPAGTWLNGQWSRTYVNDYVEGGPKHIVTGGSHGVDFPTSTGLGGTTMDQVAVSPDQLADINAAAGGGLSASFAQSVSDTTEHYFLSVTLTITTIEGVTMTLERATVYEGAQIGVETTPGTVVAANRRLLGVEFDMDNMTAVRQYRPQGSKFFTTRQMGKEFTSGRITGILSYHDMLYLASSWMEKTTPTTPANNSKWNVTGASGTVGFTFNGSTLAPASYVSAAAFQAAIEAMPGVGAGNARVTGASPTYAIEFVGALSATVLPITAATGTPLPTIALDHAATLTRRWEFDIAPFGPDDIQTYSIEKGVVGQASMSQRAPFMFVAGLGMKFTKEEASINGSFVAQATTDPVTQTASPTDVTQVPVDPSTVGVWMGPSLTSMTKMQRVLTLDFGVENRASGLMTLNDDDPSFSNRIEGAPDLSTRFFVEHNTEGQAMLARLRANTPVYAVVRMRGPLIEAGFYYQMIWMYRFGLVKPNTGDTDGAYGKEYEGGLEYDPTLGTALKLIIDAPQSAL